MQIVCDSLETSAYRLTFLSLKVRGIQDLQTGIFPVCDIFLMGLLSLSVTALFTRIVESLLFTGKTALCERIPWGQKKVLYINSQYIDSQIYGYKSELEGMNTRNFTLKHLEGSKAQQGHCPPVCQQGRGEIVHVSCR